MTELTKQKGCDGSKIILMHLERKGISSLCENSAQLLSIFTECRYEIKAIN